MEKHAWQPSWMKNSVLKLKHRLFTQSNESCCKCRIQFGVRGLEKARESWISWGNWHLAGRAAWTTATSLLFAFLYEKTRKTLACKGQWVEPGDGSRADQRAASARSTELRAEQSQVLNQILIFSVKLDFKIWATHSKFLKPNGTCKEYLQIRFDTKEFQFPLTWD